MKVTTALLVLSWCLIGALVLVLIMAGSADAEVWAKIDRLAAEVDR